MVKIITDSTCDLSKELVEKLNVEVIPLYVNFSDEAFLDGIELTTEKLYEKVEEKMSFLKHQLFLFQHL